MRRDEKSVVIDEVATNIQESQAIFAVDYRGITVAQAATLRSTLREADARFTVVKNTLTERAADQVGAEGLKPFLQGPTAMTFVRGDAAAAAKALSDFARLNGGLLEFKGGYMNGASLTPGQIEDIAKLPSREVLYGRLVGMVASPLTGLAGALGGLVGGLARQLAQIAEQGLVGGDAPAASAQAAAADTSDAASGDGDAAAGDGSPAGAPSGDPDTEPASEPGEAGPHPDPAPGDEPAQA